MNLECFRIRDRSDRRRWICKFYRLSSKQKLVVATMAGKKLSSRFPSRFCSSLSKDVSERTLVKSLAVLSSPCFL